jgi:hypothetical protein
MTPAEITILALVYVATLLLAQRGAAFVFPDAQEIGFAAAAIVGSLLAGFLYHSRERRDPTKMVIFSAGATMAVLALVVGELTQLLWQPFLYPSISLAAAAFGTLLLPFVLFRVGKRIVAEGGGVEEDAVGVTHVILVSVLATAAVIGAAMLPAPGHSSLRLIPQTFPSLTISLPDWQIEEKNVSFASGNVRLADPGGGNHFLAVRWVESELVQPDDYVKVIFAGTLDVRDRTPTFISGHEGATFLLASPGTEDYTAASIWYCKDDRRVLWITSHLSGDKSTLMATHQRIVDHVVCHTREGMPSTQASEAVFPAFTPPPGFVRDPQSKSMVYLGDKRQTIVFDSAVPGRSALVDAVVSPDMVATMLKSIGSLETINGTPQLRNVPDLLGHERRVWTATGTSRERNAVQVEVMVWWCDRRDMTFIGAYATQGTHKVDEGINALLPAICHSE